MATDRGTDASARELAEQWQHLDTMVERQMQRLLVKRERKPADDAPRGALVFNPNTGRWWYSSRPVEQPTDSRVPPVPAPWHAPPAPAPLEEEPLAAGTSGVLRPVGEAAVGARRSPGRPSPAEGAPAPGMRPGEAAAPDAGGAPAPSLPHVPPARLPLVGGAELASAPDSEAKPLRDRLAALESALKAATERSAGEPAATMTQGELLALLAERDRLLGQWVAAEAAARLALEEAIAERDRLADAVAAHSGLPAAGSAGQAEDVPDRGDAADRKLPSRRARR